MTELYDPTIKYTQTASVENPIAAAYSHSGAAINRTTYGNPYNNSNVQFCANNFIVFL